MSGKHREQRAAKVQYWRIVKIDGLIRSGACPDSTRLARELEVTQRTVKRDIEYLRLYFGAPIEYDAGQKGYRYASPGFSLPAVSLTEEELAWLKAAPAFFESFRRTPLYGAVKAVFDKISRACPGSVSVASDRFAGGFSALGEPGTSIGREVWDAVLSALRNRKPLEITYRAPGGPARRRTVDPYHALCHRGEWYLVAGTPDGIRTFAVSRMSRPRAVPEGAVKLPPGFDAREYMRDSFGVFRGERLKTVRIAFSPEAAPYVRERIWHRSQRLRERRDGGLELSFAVNHLAEVKRWALSWGRGAVALAPPELVREMAEEAGAMRKNYRR